jgi:hypothetical protein
MGDKFVKLDELINGNINYASEKETQFIYGLLDDEENKYHQKIYQSQGIINTNKNIFKYVGTAKERPTVSIYKFNYDKYKCEIMSYLLSETDLEEVNKDCYFRLIGIVIKNKDNIVGVLNLVFYTVAHKINKKNIAEYLEQEIDGIYAIDYHYLDQDSNLKVERIKILDNFLGKTKSIYELLECISSEKLIKLINK